MSGIVGALALGAGVAGANLALVAPLAVLAFAAGLLLGWQKRPVDEEVERDGRRAPMVAAYVITCAKCGAPAPLDTSPRSGNHWK